MEQAHRELLVSRILAGCLRCKVLDHDGKEITIVIKKPSLEQIYVAQQLYQDYKQALELEGCMTEEEAVSFLLKQKLWTEEKQASLDSFIKDIEEFKVKLFKMTFKTDEKRTAKKALAFAKEQVNKLTAEKGALSYLTTTGGASVMRTRYLIAMSCYYLDGTPLFTEQSFWQDDSSFFDYIVDCYYKSRIEESAYREICRTEPWRSIWNGRKAEGRVIGIPSAELSDEQRTLITWSGIYDSVYEHPECPSDEVIDDDDILDGWMILQQRKRKEQKKKARADDFIENDKIRNSGEVFIPANTMSDAKEIDELNDTHAKIVKKQRLAFARKKGEVHEHQMPDTMQELQMELTRMTAQGVKNNG